MDKKQNDISKIEDLVKQIKEKMDKQHICQKCGNCPICGKKFVEDYPLISYWPNTYWPPYIVTYYATNTGMAS